MTAPKKDREAALERWRERVRICWGELVRVRQHREIWQAITDALREQQEAQSIPYNEWWLHYTRLYQASQVMALRRLSAPPGDGNEISLPRLVDAMRRNPAVLDFHRFAAEWGGDTSLDWGDTPRQVWEKYAGETDTISGERLNAIADRIAGACAEIRAAADTRYAHIDEVPWNGEMTPAKIAEAIDQLTEEFHVVALLLTGSELSPQHPSLGDWQRPFRQPLFEPTPYDRRRCRWPV